MKHSQQSQSRENTNLAIDQVSVSDVFRFMKYVEQGEACWTWKGATSNAGYGVFNLRGVYVLAHRLAYLMHTGTRPGQKNVLHRCDNPRCVRPEHLFVGTQGDNVADKIAKGRQPRGEQVGTAKLTTAAVRDILKMRQSGFSQRAAAARYGVCQSTISGIERSVTWKHVSGQNTERRGRTLTASVVAEIRRLGLTKTQMELAALFGVTQSTISDILRHRTWRAVDRRTRKYRQTKKRRVARASRRVSA